MTKPRVVFQRLASTTSPGCSCATYAPEEPIDEVDLSEPTESASWAGVLVVEGTPTGDGRMIQRGALRWGDLPIPLRWAREDEGGHFGAVVVGRITAMRRDGDAIAAEGDFDLGSEEGREALRQVQQGLTTGVSVDLDDVDLEVRVASELLDMDEDTSMLAEVGFAPEGEEPPEPETDEEGRVTLMEIHSDDELLVTTDARVRAATMVATPAFVEARIELTGETSTVEDEPAEELGKKGKEKDHVVASSVDDRRPPADWFADPELDGPTPFTITEDGRVFGHLATWGTCHTAFPNECVTAPLSPSGYAYFRTGSIRTRNGAEVATGRVTLDTMHAGRRLSATDTAAHYEHTGVAIADVAAGEDAHGIWIAGSLRPSATPEQVDVLRASPLSGDWRRIGGSLELVAALAVNSPGFPIPRALVAGGAVQSLLGLRSVTPDPTPPGELSASDAAILARLAARERKAEAGRRDAVESARQRVLVASAASRVQKGR